MRSDSNQIDDISFNPYQQVIVSLVTNMALHTVLIISFEWMGLVFFRYRYLVDKHIDYFLEGLNLIRIAPILLEVFLELT